MLKLSNAPSLLVILLAPYLPGFATAASLQVTLTDQAGNPVDDAILYVTSINGRPESPPPPKTVIIDQVDEMFVPAVRAISAGSTINFPNSDHIRHHVYSFSDAKTFELPLYSGIPAEPVTFDKAGLVTLGCNIHDHMIGYVLVLDTPYHAEVRAGTATIDDLPAGELAVEIWHPRLERELPLQLAVITSGDVTTSVQQQVDLRPERMVRRAPRRGATRY